MSDLKFISKTSHHRTYLRSLIYGLGLLFCISSSYGSDYVAERAWVEDPSGSLTLEHISKLPESTSLDNLFGSGFSTSTYWIRLRIDPTRGVAAKSDDSLIIRIRPVYHDQIWIYDPLGAQDKERVTGDYYNWANDEWQSLNLNFVIPIGKQPRDVWLKLRTHQALYTSIDVLTEREAIATDRRQDAWAMFCLASLAFILAWGCLTWVSQRDPLIGWFNLRTITALAYIFFLLGYGRMFLSSEVPEPLIDRLFNISLWSFVAAAIWFDAHLLNEFKANRWLVYAVKMLVIMLPIELLTILFDRIDIGVRLNFLVTILATVLVFFAAISTRAWKDEGVSKEPTQRPAVPKYVFVGLYTLAILIVVFNRLAIMRVIPPPENLLDYILLYPMPISFFMMLLLHLRSHQLKLQHQADLRGLDIAKREAEFERSRRIEDERFISMLTHELKTPISVAKINLGMSGLEGKERERIERALKNMNDVVERCRISSAIEDERLKIEVEAFSVRTAIEDLLGLVANPDRVKLSEVNDEIVHSDSQLFGIVVSNLLDNALKYSLPNTEISVSYMQKAHQGKLGLSVFVSNQITPDRIPDSSKMFTKYYRSRSAESKSGSGLGLYLSSGIAQLLGGFLTYQATDHMMEFEFWLPA
jgi:signal transduction histidine kinase